MDTAQALAFYSSVAQVAATFAGIMIVAVVWLFERGGFKRFRWFFVLLIISTVLFAFSAIESLWTLLYLGTDLAISYAQGTLFSLVGAIIIIVFAFFISPKSLAIEQSKGSEPSNELKHQEVKQIGVSPEGKSIEESKEVKK